MKTWARHYQYPIAILSIGLLWLWFLNSLLQLNAQHFIYPDSQDYHLSAVDLFLRWKLHAYRPMLMAFITGLPFWFGSSNAGIYQWSFYVNVVCWLSTALLLFAIAKHFLKEKSAFIVAIASFFMVGNAVLNYHLLTETIYTFCITAVFYFLFRYFKNRQFWLLSAALSILLLAMLIKPGSKFLAIVFVLFFIKEIYKNFKKKSALWMYFSLGIIAVQVIGIQNQYGDYTISYIDGVTYHDYLFSKADAYQKGKIYDQMNNPRTEYIFGFKNPSDQKKVALADLKNQMQNNMINVCKAYVSDVIDNTKSGNVAIADLKNELGKPNFETNQTVFFWISKWQNRIFTLCGIILAMIFIYKEYKKEKQYALLGFFILYIVVLSGISCGQGDRFHLVIFPFVMVLFARWLQQKRVIS